jgi:hypothetical protein
VKVRHLDWGEPYLNEIKETAVNAHSSCGRYIASDHGWFLCGLTQWNEAANIDAAKAAAQADYEARILPALTLEPVKAGDEVMREAAAWQYLKADGKWIDCSPPNEAELENTPNRFRPLFSDMPACGNIRKALEGLLRCPVIADTDYTDPAWGDVETSKAIDAAREALSTTAPQPDNGARGNQSDGGSRKQPFDPADAAGVKSGTVTFDGQTGRPNRDEVGASQIPGSSMSFAADKPIVAGQAPGPSDPAPAEPVHSVGLRGALEQAKASHASMLKLTKAPPRSVDVEAIALVITNSRLRRHGRSPLTMESLRAANAVDELLAVDMEAARSIAAMIEGE